MKIIRYVSGAVKKISVLKMVKIVDTINASSSSMGTGLTKISPHVTTYAHPSVHYAGMRPNTMKDATMKTSQENFISTNRDIRHTAELSQHTTRHTT